MNNIVLIVVDCGRFDKFQNKVAATFINQLADKGWNFTNAISPYNQTQSAMASMFTGKLPSEHLVQSHGHRPCTDGRGLLVFLLGC